jgi:putative pyruvate formate lyase activating enzyme
VIVSGKVFLSVADVWEPPYVALQRSGELRRRAEQACAMLAACNLCYRACGVNRLDSPPSPPILGGATEAASAAPFPPELGGQGGKGVCRAGSRAVVASWTAHKWEEPPLSGTGGAGTIFFGQCTGRCIYCQNYPISQLDVGREVSVERLAWMMLDLQKRGCHNVEFVTPTHYLTPILAALDMAAAQGLRLPLVWNTNGYDSVDTLRLLDGVIDIYLPDAKYADDRVALRLSGFPHWTAANRACLLEMHRQMGDELVLDEHSIARRGMIIRHLILPNNLSQTPDVLRWIAENLSPNVHVSLMNQYFPTYKTVVHPTLGRRVSPEEYAAALDAFEAAGLNNGWGQELPEENEDYVATNDG